MIFLLLAACGSSEPPVEPADLVVTGELRPGGAYTAVIVRDGVVAELVTDREKVDAYVGPDTVRVDGDVVTAGFVDAHAHPAGLATALATLDLVGSPSYADTLERVRRATGEGWVLGRGWDQNDWSDAPEGGWPLATDLDGVTGGRPAVLRRVDGHAAWLNTAALDACGITSETPDPAGGRILRDAAGKPTGVLVDNALELVQVPPESAEVRRARMEAALQAIAATGLTGVHDMGAGAETLALYETLATEGALPIRVWAYADPAADDVATRLVEEGPYAVGHLEVVGFKLMADGALGSRGALLTDPYADEPGHHGNAVMDADELSRRFDGLAGGGAQIAVHAIGDAAVHEVLDIFENADALFPDHARVRHRVEHAQVVRPEDRGRFAAMDVIASMQPTHATSDMPWAEDRLGPERIQWAYTWRTLADAGAPLAFGSDFPVEHVDPALGLWSAEHRTDLEGHPPGGWTPSERVTLDEAITAFTAGAAYAVHEEDRLGAVRVGAPADLTVWAIRDNAPWQAAATVVDGVVVASPGAR